MSQPSTAAAQKQGDFSYKEPLLVWLILVALTFLTVSVTYIDFNHLFVVITMLIATVKSSLVLLYFMHLRHEKPLFFYMIGAALTTYAIFIVLTFSDYWLRTL